MVALRQRQNGQEIVDVDVDQFVKLLTGLEGIEQPVSLTRVTDPSEWSLTVRHRDEDEGKAFRVQTPDGALDYVLMGRAATNANDFVSFNWINSDDDVTNYRFVVTARQPANANPNVMQLNYHYTEAAASDSSAITAIMDHDGTGATAIRAGEFHAIRRTGGTSALTWAIEAGVHSNVVGAQSYHNVGVYVYSSDAFLTGTAQRGNTGILIEGAAGWENGIRYNDVDNGTILFAVNQTGIMTSGDHIAKTTNIHDLGLSDGTVVWRAAYVNQFRSSAFGSASAVDYGWRADPNTGFYHGAGADDFFGVTAGLVRIELDANGNVVLGSQAIATSSTNGFLHIVGCAGTPTGTPTNFGGRYPMIYDSTAHKIWIYDSGWRGVAVV